MNPRTALKTGLYKALTLAFGDQDGLVRLPVIAGPARGLRFRLDLERRKEALFWGSYDRVILERLSKIITPGWTVWDCGTYLGFYTAFFARAVGPSGKVVAIEPDPRNLKRTRENVELNGYFNVQFESLAIGASCGRSDFILSENTNSHLPGYHVKTRERQRQLEAGVKLQMARVQCSTLDELYRNHSLPRPHLIKIDIEGAEKDALQFASTLAAAEARPLIALELHNADCDEAAWRFAQEMKYRIMSLESGRLITERADTFGTLLLH